MLLVLSAGTCLASVNLRVYYCNLRKLNLLSGWKMKPFTAESLYHSQVGGLCSLKGDSDLDILSLGRQSYLLELFVLELFVTLCALAQVLSHSPSGSSE